MRALAPFALVPAIFVVSALLIPGFASVNSVRSILLLASLLGIACVGQSLTIVLGGLDLSVPSVIGMADVTVAQLFGAGWPIWSIVSIVTALACVIGLANALLSRLLRVHPLIVTLATGSIVLGAVLATTHGQATGTVPDWLTNAVSVVGQTGKIPLPGAVVLWIVIASAVVALERCTVFGKQLFAVGSNPVAADFARVPALRVWAGAYVTSALFAALAGALLAGFSGAADASVGEPYLFASVAAVVVGGTSLLGGRGGYLSSVAGCLIITELTTLLIGVGFDEPTQQLCLGIVIVAVVSLYGREPHVRMRI